MPSFVTPRKNTAYTFYISLVSQANTKIFRVNPTLAAADFNVAIDDAAPAALGTTPVVDADFTKRVKVALAAGEMNGDNITLICSDAAGAEWCDLTINIQTSARQIDDLAWPTTSGRSLAVDANSRIDVGSWLGTAVTTSATTAKPEVDAFSISNDATAANNAELAFDTTGYGFTNCTMPTTTTAVNLTTNNDKTGYALSAVGVDAVWDEPLALHTTADTPGQVVNMLTQDTVTLSTDVALGSIVGQALDAGTTWTFDRTTDSLEILGAATAPTAAVIADAVWDEDATAHQVQGTFGQAIGDPVADADTIWGLANTNLDAAVSSRMATYTQPTGFLAATFPAGTVANTTNITAGTITTATNLTTNNDKTGYSLGVGGIAATAFAAGAVDAAAIAADAITSSELAQSAAQEVADEVLNRNLAGGGSGNTRNVRNSLRVLRNKVSEAAGTLTVTEEDDTTSAWTATTTRTAGLDPLSGVDPA